MKHLKKMSSAQLEKRLTKVDSLEQVAIQDILTSRANKKKAVELVKSFSTVDATTPEKKKKEKRSSGPHTSKKIESKLVGTEVTFNPYRTDFELTGIVKSVLLYSRDNCKYAYIRSGKKTYYKKIENLNK